MTQVKPLPDREWLLENLRYESETGLLWWKKTGKGRDVSRPCGCPIYRYDGEPQAIQVRIHGKVYLAHRLAWAMVTGEDPGCLTVDHINRNPVDNRFSNLRLADMSLQMKNRNTYGRSEHKGVHFHVGNGKWVARHWRQGKYVHLGSFATEKEAAAAAARYYGS